ncbi:MAG: amidohydrolase family protein [Verrucomicrobia bacterium]|nr:MAG: amidohydrolase family protein [Verrucomicrobiota bacterium]
MTSRRSFLGSLAGAVVAAGCTTPPNPAPAGIVDTHTHFYDPTRAEGVPWPPPGEARLYRPVLPAEYRRLAEPLGIVGTVVVEASPRESDNDWVLERMAREPFLMGLVGHLKPGRPGFAEGLDRYARNPLFRGIRTGGWEVRVAPADAAFVRDCLRLARRDLALDVLVSPAELPRVAELAEAAPDLRIVVDHCANVRVDGRRPPDDWLRGLDACAAHGNVHFKVSGLVEGTGRNDGSAPHDPAYYRDVVDAVWQRFGPRRVLYGTNWPVSALFAPLDAVHAIVQTDATRRGARAAAAFFRGNAERVYRLRNLSR